MSTQAVAIAAASLALVAIVAETFSGSCQAVFSWRCRRC